MKTEKPKQYRTKKKRKQRNRNDTEPKRNRKETKNEKQRNRNRNETKPKTDEREKPKPQKSVTIPTCAHVVDVLGGDLLVLSEILLNMRTERNKEGKKTKKETFSDQQNIQPKKTYVRYCLKEIIYWHLCLFR